MKMHILFTSGVTAVVDVTSETEAGMFNERGGRTIKYPPPPDWTSKLDYADISAITAIWFTRAPATAPGDGTGDDA